MLDQVTLRKLKNRLGTDDFDKSYQNLVLGHKDEISRRQKLQLLRAAIALINFGNENTEKLGYRILLRFAILFSEYTPLYDYAINRGYVPITKLLEGKYLDVEDFNNSLIGNLVHSYQQNFADENQDIFLSLGQKLLYHFSETSEDSYAIVAPTSYGKSEIIINEAYRHLDSKLCILVPTKALLAQTKKRLVDHYAFGEELSRVITHPDMYRESDDAFVAVLTQERLLRLLQKNPQLRIENLLVDEAHNLFSDNSRSKLLAHVILITRKRNEHLKLRFYTPFISDSDNLEIPYSNYQLSSKKVTEFIKIERFYLCDLTEDSILKLYDQFINEFYDIIDLRDYTEIEFLQQYKGDKNIIYLNRPKHIEDFAVQLFNESTISENAEIESAKSAISEYVHEEYRLLKCLDAGFVYHHGGMPEIVRLYVENLFSSISDLEFIITSSTLLEGVNIPAQKLFLLTVKIGRRKFTRSQFKNLVGRICRFSEAFNKDTGNLNLLEPSIYYIKSQYEDSRINSSKFFTETARIDRKITDNVENILLKDKDELDDEDKEELEASIEYLENIEPETIEDAEVDYVGSEIAKSCYRNNIHEFDIKSNEQILISNLESFEESNSDLLQTANEVINAIFEIFIHDVPLKSDNLKRLRNSAARSFYSMFLDWRSRGSSYKEMIANFVNYWESKDDKITYVGSRWGEIKYSSANFRDLYVDLSQKSHSELVNLAIVRTKEEQDLVDNIFIKYVEVLNDLELIEPDLRDKIKYGTDDQQIISLLKNGISLDLARELIKPEFRDFITIDTGNDQIEILPSIIELLEEEGINKILIFEAKHHTK